MIAVTVAEIGAALAALVGVSRALALRRARRSRSMRPTHPVGADGVTVGAETLRLQGTDDRGLLIVHGFNDTPQSVAKLARALHERGWTVVAPLLPHHGRVDGENAREGTSNGWIAAARAEWAALRAKAPRAVLAGQSMGGAIAAILAAEEAPAALVLLAPYFAMGRLARVLSAMWPITGIALPVIASNPTRGLRDPAARAGSLAAGEFTPRMSNELRQVVNRAHPLLPQLRVPTLMMQGRADYRIPSASAQRAFDRLGSGDKTLAWVDNVGHVLAADSAAADVCAQVGAWLDTRIPPR